MSGKKMMEIVDEPYLHSNKVSYNIDLYILCEGFKYTLREWRRWTHDEVVVDEDCILTRGKYSMEFVNMISEFLQCNGYILKYNIDSIARRFMHYWLQLYNSNGRCARLPLPHHNGNALEYEKWDNTFPQEFWDDVTEDIIVYKGFDDTDVGRELLLHMGNFFWNYIDVSESPTIIAMREEERRIHEELIKLAEEPSESVKVFINTTSVTSKNKTDEVNDRNNREK
jgi:hypothetical protein